MGSKTLAEFRLFQRYFKEYQNRFGLLDYKTYFEYKPMEGYFSDVKVDHVGMVATVRLNSRLPKSSKEYQNIRQNAKHEAIHLLIADLEYLATERYTSEVEVERMVEKLVYRLEKLIDG